MDYELVKQLKDAGFPLQENHWAATPLTFDISLHRFDKEVLEPTLEELMKACGEGFGAMERYLIGETKLHTPSRQPMFVVGNYINRDGEIEGHRCEGSTPEEAVARLWLALHENTQTAKSN